MTDEMNESLVTEVTDEEIKKPTFQMSALKAPGPNGFNGLFFQRYWEIVGQDVCSAVKSFFHEGYMLKEINKTNMVLIPKVQIPEKVTQFRPLGLCNFIYRIIAKIMVKRLKNMLSSIISENQAAFIPKRVIHDNIIIAHECFHYLKRKKER